MYIQALENTVARVGPFLRKEHGTLLFDDIGYRKLDNEKLAEAEQRKEGSSSYWRNLLEYDRKLSESILSTTMTATQSYNTVERSRQSKIEKRKKAQSQFAKKALKDIKHRRWQAKEERLARQYCLGMLHLVALHSQRADSMHSVANAFDIQSGRNQLPAITPPMLLHPPRITLNHLDCHCLWKVTTEVTMIETHPITRVLRAPNSLQVIRNSFSKVWNYYHS